MNMKVPGALIATVYRAASMNFLIIHRVSHSIDLMCIFYLWRKYLVLGQNNGYYWMTNKVCALTHTVF